MQTRVCLHPPFPGYFVSGVSSETMMNSLSSGFPVPTWRPILKGKLLSLMTPIVFRSKKTTSSIVVNGKEWDLFRPIESYAKVRILTRKDPEALELIRHDAAHVLAMAVQELFPGTQVTIGPAIEDGFYYDFARNEPFTPDDLPKIEAKMHEIVARDLPTKRVVWPRDKAIQHFESIGEQYKAELGL